MVADILKANRYFPWLEKQKRKENETNVLKNIEKNFIIWSEINNSNKEDTDMWEENYKKTKICYKKETKYQTGKVIV